MLKGETMIKISDVKIFNEEANLEANNGLPYIGIAFGTATWKNNLKGEVDSALLVRKILIGNEIYPDEDFSLYIKPCLFFTIKATCSEDAYEFCRRIKSIIEEYNKKEKINLEEEKLRKILIG
jgi:hypothetical protein